MTSSDRVRTTITMDEELKKTVQSIVGNRNMSSTIEELLREHVVDSPKHQSVSHALEKSDLAPRQKEAVKLIVEESLIGESLRSITGMVRKSAVYQQKESIKGALKRISNDPAIPLELQNGELEAKEISCDCGAKFYSSVLTETDGRCRNCQKTIIPI